MKVRAYGQFCGLARALEIVGERWAVLIVRDLLVGPKRFTDLLHGLPRIPTNVLAARLKQLEAAGVVRRRVLPRPAGSVIYELTEYGAELEDVIVRLGRWGAKLLDKPRPDEIITQDSMVMALRSTFHPEAARKVRAGYELHFGDIVVYARVDKGKLEAAAGPLPKPDLIIEAGPAIKGLMDGTMSPSQAIKNGSVHLTGDAELLTRFAEIFRIEPMPANAPALGEGRV
ncbi:MAG: winged helix-turn-helix transcriptional regulator [Candidatus Eremiobacteraeota bacterium]|nr:winged helix-turn-helix transcriptional regulator [Candidatus Eremiobacteraeota bacterium]